MVKLDDEIWKMYDEIAENTGEKPRGFWYMHETVTEYKEYLNQLLKNVKKNIS